MIRAGFLRKSVERVMGIGPTQPAWKAGILPLNYTRIVVFGAVSTTLVYNSTNRNNCQIIFALFFKFLPKNFPVCPMYRNFHKMLKTNSKKAGGQILAIHFQKRRNVWYNKEGRKGRGIRRHLSAAAEKR